MFIFISCNVTMELTGLVYILLLILHFSVCAYEIPDVRIQALSPKGLRVSIPHSPNMSLFVFQANVNRAISNNQVGSITGEVLEPTNGQWVYVNTNVQLKVGDVIHYYVFVSVDGAGYLKDKNQFTVTALETPTSTDRPRVSSTTKRPKTTTTTTTTAPTTPPIGNECKPSVTQVRGARVCSGQTIFEDNFNTLNEDFWQVEQYIPFGHPEHPFISYQRSQVSVADGVLRIVPTLQQNMNGFDNDSISSGDLNLFNGCTGQANECAVSASGADILPPIASGRVTSKGFAFTYGKVQIRAKLPQGDWLYPELLLESFRKKYGTMFASGVLKIAAARGNAELNVGVSEFGNQVLYGGPIMDYACRHYLIQEKKRFDGKKWGDDYHVYTVNWTPDRITLIVDDEEWARVEPRAQGLQALFPPGCKDIPRNFLAFGTKMAPFDDHFFLTLGVAAGGITEFRDDFYTSGDIPKPWKNSARKASLNFWNDQNSWLPTWTRPGLLVDYVKVIAL